MEKTFKKAIFIIIFILISACQNQDNHQANHYVPPKGSPFLIEFDYPKNWTLGHDKANDPDFIILDSRNSSDLTSLFVTPTSYPDKRLVYISIESEIKDMNSLSELVNQKYLNEKLDNGEINQKLDRIEINGNLIGFRLSYVIINTPLYQMNLDHKINHDLYTEEDYLFIGHQALWITPIIDDLHDNPEFARGFAMVINSMKAYR